MVTFDIVTPATLRPELHKQTYESFCDCLIGVDWKSCRHFLNIDNAPLSRAGKGLEAECIAISKKYFGETIPNIPKEPNCTQAYNWLFSRAQTKVILCLEDDWKMVLTMHVSSLIEPFRNHRTLTQVVLRAYPCEKYGGIYPSNCISPSLMHRRFYSKLAGNMDTARDPEWNMHHHGDRFGLNFPYRRNGLSPTQFVMAFPEDYHILAVKDIGREWAKENGIHKPEKKKEFTQWTEDLE